MIVKLLVEGGNMAPGPALAQKIGPMGINMGKVISEVNKATAEFKGTKVPIDLNIDPATKEFKIIIKSPPVAELIKKELNIQKCSGDHKKTKVGNIAIEQIIKISKAKLADALEKDLKAMVKTVVGNCISLGILIENKEPVEVAKEIAEGKYDKEINLGKMDVSPEKKKELQEFFSSLIKKQEAAKKVEEAASVETAEKPSEEKKETTPSKEKSKEKPSTKAKPK